MATPVPRRPSLLALVTLLAVLLPAVLARKLLQDILYIVNDDVIGSFCEVIVGSPSDPFSSVDVCLKVHQHPSQHNTISHMDFIALVEGVTSASTPSPPTISLTESHTITVPCNHYESEPYPYIEGSLLYRCEQNIPKEAQRVILEGLDESPLPIVTFKVGDSPVRITLSHSVVIY
ncbi:hypothetical protein CLOP_g25037 [Closterium sp. NIES-67]|nr:hypothetical protein CLOP_g25037 [Closterium sp. NIES-67]